MFLEFWVNIFLSFFKLCVLGVLGNFFFKTLCPLGVSGENEEGVAGGGSKMCFLGIYRSVYNQDCN